MDISLDELRKLAAEAGMTECGTVNVADVNFSHEVRKMCEADVCRKYGRTWACPPAVGTIEECRDKCRRYRTLLLFSRKREIEDSFDFEGMEEAAREFKRAARKFEALIKPRFSHYLMLSNEGCGECTACAYPEPCRLPGRAHGSIEAYGIMVSETAAAAGIKYINGPNTVTYFGGLFYDLL